MVKEIVVDASIVLAAILNEPEKRAIVEITAGRDLIAPACIKWEIGNAFSAMLKRKRMKPEQIKKAIDTFSVIPIKEIDIDLYDALELCRAHRIYAYDAFYLLVSKRFSRPLLTLDERMGSVAKLEGINVEEIKS